MLCVTLVGQFFEMLTSYAIRKGGRGRGDGHIVWILYGSFEALRKSMGWVTNIVYCLNKTKKIQGGDDFNGKDTLNPTSRRRSQLGHRIRSSNPPLQTSIAMCRTNKISYATTSDNIQEKNPS